MRITYYGYNTFLIEAGDKKLAIDPGALFLYYFQFTTLIPKSEWEDITHIFVTHGDPDHYWHTDRVAMASNAAVICNKTMLSKNNGQPLLLGPRSKGLTFDAPIDNVHTISVDETMDLDGISITGLKANHGPLLLKVGPLSKKVWPGPGERIGWGSIGFAIQINGKRIVNLGDSLLLCKEWSAIKKPDVLMLPIGGRVAGNTMDEEEALTAVKEIRPKLVIPCHYNERALFNKKYCPADDKTFKYEVEKAGLNCEVMQSGQSIMI